MTQATAQKPPLGVPPKSVWLKDRQVALARAIYQYLAAGLEPDPEWGKEYCDIQAILRSHRS